jgi:outer membrane protein assembly factor BamB
MRRRLQGIVAAVLPGTLLLLLVSIAGAQENAPSPTEHWPQWRGPEGTGVAPHGNPPTRWSETENVRWKVKIPGNGASTPIIWNDRVFIQTAIEVETPASSERPNDAVSPAKSGAAPPAPAPPPGEQPQGRRGGGFRSSPPTQPYQFVLLCLDRQSGKTLWKSVAREELPHEGHHKDHGYSSSSPVTDGEHVYAYFGSRGLYCFDLEGNLKWEKDLGKMQTRNAFGEGSSPALHKNTLVVTWDHEGDDFIVALDKRSGKELWRQARDEPTTWATPLIVELDGKAQVVTAATNRVRSYDLATGEVVWEADGLTTNAIPSPVTSKGIVYVMSGFRGAELMAIRLGSTGDVTGTDAVVWKHDKNTPYVPSPLLYGDRLYFFSGNTGILSCFNVQTGKPLMETQRIGALPGVYASPVGAAGKVYLLGREGSAVVIRDSDAFEVLAINQLEERFDASPAVAGNELFLRGHQFLYCIAAEAE